MENAIQLRITTDMNTLPSAIEFNYEELKTGLESYLERFDGLVVTEDAIRQATVDRAEINRVARTIARARIDTKKRVLEPFELFEARAKELEGLCKAAEEKIAWQLEAFENTRAEKKRVRLLGIWWDKLSGAFDEATKQCDTANEYFQAFFDAHVNPKTKGCWLNKGSTDDVVTAEMDAEIKRCKELLGMVEGMYAETDEETRAKAKLEAMRTMDLQRTVQAVNAFRAERETLAEARKAAEERARAEEWARRAAEERARAEAERAKEKAAAAPAPATATPPPSPTPAVEDDDGEDVVIAPQPEKRNTITMRLTATNRQFCQLKEAMEKIGIAYERI